VVASCGDQKARVDKGHSGGGAPWAGAPKKGCGNSRNVSKGSCISDSSCDQRSKQDSNDQQLRRGSKGPGGSPKARQRINQRLGAELGAPEGWDDTPNALEVVLRLVPLGAGVLLGSALGS
jgi:hypothetical protein